MTPSEPPHLQGAIHWVEVPDGTKIRVLDVGHGREACVLVHGTADGGYVWADQVANLGVNRRVICLDLRGHARSEWSVGGRYGIEDYLGDLRLVVERLDLITFGLIGHSMGGDLAVRLAASLGSRVKRLALVDFGPAVNLGVAEHANAACRGDCRVFGSQYAYFDILRQRHPLADEQTLLRVAAEGLRRVEGGYALRLDPRVLDGYAGPQAAVLWGMLRQIECPTLILRAVGSAMIARQTVAEMARVMTDAAVVQIMASGHAIPMDNPKALTAALDTFFPI